MLKIEIELFETKKLGEDKMLQVEYYKELKTRLEYLVKLLNECESLASSTNDAIKNDSGDMSSCGYLQVDVLRELQSLCNHIKHCECFFEAVQKEIEKTIELVTPIAPPPYFENDTIIKNGSINKCSLVL